MQSLSWLGRGILWCVASVEGRVFLIGKVCLLTAVYFSFFTARGCIVAKSRSLRAFEVPLNSELSDAKAKEPLEAYSIIASRNIFGKDEAKPEEKATTPVKQTTLEMRLVGTRMGSDDMQFAIVEDGKSKQQDVFELNEMIFEKAKLVEIMPEAIKVEFQGKQELLVLEKAEGGDIEVTEDIDGDEIVVSEEELNEQLANLPKLLSQARAVPFFRNGESIGMRLFAIRRGSLYEKVGLKNGDILLAINDNSLSDPTQALKLFEQLKTEKELSVSVERSGQKKVLNYSIR